MTGPVRPQLWPEIRLLLLAAMVLFTYTIVIGMLNGADVVDFDRRRILGHVHAGTLGWLTLAVFAASYWLFGESAPVGVRERHLLRALTGLSIISFALATLAFSVTYGGWRAAVSIVALAPIVGVLGWVATRVRKTVLGVPHWGFLAALGTSVVGGVLGILLALQIATGDKFLPEGGEDAHPATMVVGFLIPMGLALAEWAFFFPSPPKATRGGIIQMAFPFAGGIILMVAILLDIAPLAPLAIVLQVVGLVIFYKRMWPEFRRVDWRAASAARYALVSALCGVYVVGLAQYLAIRHKGDFDLAPANHLLSLDHTQFIGVMTNAVFGMLLVATVAGGRGTPRDHGIFILVNAGIAGFALGLLFDLTVMKQIFAPIMGVGLMLGLVVSSLRLVTAVPAEAAQESEAELAKVAAEV